MSSINISNNSKFSSPHAVLFNCLPDGPFYVGYNNKKQPISLETGSLTNGRGDKPSGKVEKDQAINLGTARTNVLGLGFCLSEKAGILIIDLDGCIDEKGILQHWAQKIVTLLNSLTLVSPSGTGLHIYLKANIPPINKRLTIPEAETICSKAPGIEIFNTKKYIRLASHIYKGYDILRDYNEDLYNTAFSRYTNVIVIPGKEEDFKKHIQNLRKEGIEEKEGFATSYRDVFFTRPLIIDMLGYIPADEYSLWLRMAYALKHESSNLTEDDAYEIFNEWSKTTETGNYNEQKNHRIFYNLKEDPTKEPSEICTVNSIKYEAEKRGWVAPIPKWILELNKLICLVRDNNKLLYGHKNEKGEWGFLNKSDWIMLTLRYGNILQATDNGKVKPVPKYRQWLLSPYRKEFTSGFQFLPEQAAQEGFFNTWEGWRLQTKEGEWPNIKEFIYNIICDENDTLAKYIFGWCAHLIQKPWEKPRVALVMRGVKRIGKGFFVNKILKPLVKSKNYLGTRQDALVRDFNAHLGEALIIFADEYIWKDSTNIRNKKTDAALRTVISEGSLFLTPKYQEGRNCETVCRIVIATNERFFGDLSQGEKRFAVWDVSSSRADNRDYFNKLEKHMVNELSAFWHDMKHLDLSSFKLEDLPKTDAFVDQIQNSLPPSIQWFKECLDNNYIIPGLPWPDYIEAVLFYQQYVNWHKRVNAFEPPLSKRGFKKELVDSIGIVRVKKAKNMLQKEFVIGDEDIITAYFLGDIKNCQEIIDDWLRK